MFLVNALQVLCGRTVIEVFSRPHSLNFVYISRGSRDLARQALLFLCHFLLFYLFLQFFFCDKEQKKGLFFVTILQNTGRINKEKGKPALLSRMTIDK